MQFPHTDLTVEVEIEGTPWTKGPWFTGQAPHAHCRVYSHAEPHAIARTYGPDLNEVGICSLTGPNNAADAALIAKAPEMASILIKLKVAYELGEARDEEKTALMMNLTAIAMTEATVLIDQLFTETGKYLPQKKTH